MTTTID